jgi:hypothetical protein
MFRLRPPADRKGCRAWWPERNQGPEAAFEIARERQLADYGHSRDSTFPMGALIFSPCRILKEQDD